MLSRRTLLIGLLLAACAGGDAPEAASEAELLGRLTLTGSSTVAPLAAEIARRFESRHPQVRVDVQTGGSSRGIRDAREGTADIGMASRGLEAAEQNGLLAHAIARDEIAVILHATNPVETLSDEQIKAIYLGEISRWSEIGGRDAPITVVNKASGRATLEVFVKHYGLDEKMIDADIVIGENEQGVKTVAGNPDAIGYVSVGSARYNAGEGVPIQILDRSGTGDEAADAIVRPLNLVTRSEVDALAQSFIDYSQSSEVHDLVRGLYFEPLTQVSAR
jgi:phosphate transport system substrate-binding protein